MNIKEFIMSVFTVCAMGACADTVLCLAPKESSESVSKYARLVITLCVMCAMLSPLSGCGAADFDNAETAGGNSFTQSFQSSSSQNESAATGKTLSDIVLENTKTELENKTASHIYSELGISETQVSIQLREETTDGKASLYITEVTVSISDSTMLSEKSQQISDLVQRLTGCQNVKTVFEQQQTAQ